MERHVNDVIFGIDGWSDICIETAKVTREDKTTVAGCLSLYELEHVAPIGITDIKDAEGKMLLSRWFFQDLKSIDIVIDALNKIKKYLEEK